MPFAGHRGDDVALRVDEGERRPCACGVGLPRDEVRIVQDDVLDAVALDCLVDGLNGPFELELGAVHADDHEHVAVLLLDRTQFVQHVEAVDAAEGPEVQQHDLAAEVLEGEVLATGVDPPTTGELRGAQADAVPSRRGRRGGRAGSGSRAGGLGLGGVLLSGHAGDSPICAHPRGAHVSHEGTCAPPRVFPAAVGSPPPCADTL